MSWFSLRLGHVIQVIGCKSRVKSKSQSPSHKPSLKSKSSSPKSSLKSQNYRLESTRVSSHRLESYSSGNQTIIICENNKKLWEIIFKNQFLIGLYTKIYEILCRAFFIFITLGRVNPKQWFNHQKITNSLGLTIFFPKIPAGFGKIWKKTKGVKLTPLTFPGLTCILCVYKSWL